MRRVSTIFVLVLLGAGCAASSLVRVEPQTEFPDPVSRRFARDIAKIKVLNYTDRSRQAQAHSARALQEIESYLRERGYLVESVSRFRTTEETRPVAGALKTEYLLRNDSALHPYEGYLEVFTSEELWEGNKPFTDYEEVGSMEPGFGPALRSEKRPNFKGHHDIRRSVEVEAFLFVKGSKHCVYRRRSFVKQREFNFSRAIDLALGGIPKRRAPRSRAPALSPFFTRR